MVNGGFIRRKGMKKIIVNRIIALGICLCVLFGSTINVSITALAEEAQTQTASEKTGTKKEEEVLNEDGNQGENENFTQNKIESVDASKGGSDKNTDSAEENEAHIQEGKAEDESEDGSANTNIKADQNQASATDDPKTQEDDSEKKDESASAGESPNLLNARSTYNIALGSTIEGMVSDSNHTNAYHFNVSEAGKVTFNMTSYVRYYHIYLYDNTGKEIWSETYNYWNASLEYINDIYNIYLEKGAYSLAIEGYDGKEKYTLKTAFSSAGTNTPEPNNSFDSAVNVKFGNTYTGIFAPNDEFDNFHFTLTKSGRVSAQFTSYLSSYDYYLYDKSGKELDYSTYNRWNESQGFITNLYIHDLEKGEYYVKVQSTFGDSGKYKAKFDFKSSNATNSEPDNTYLTGTQLNMGEYYYGQIALNDSHDIYKFSLNAKTDLRINLTSYMKYCTIRILNDSGDNIWSDTYIRWNEEQGYISKVYTHTLDPGSYAIQIEECNSSTGTYKILVNDGKERIELNKTTASLTSLGQTVQLSATVRPSASVTWSSSSTKVATVNSSGKVTATGFGQATITAKTSKGATAKCTINVLPARGEIVKITNPTYTQLKIEWKKISNASGYELYRCKSANGTYTKVKTIEQSTTLSYINGGLTTGTKYFYKIRAYKIVDSKKVYGTFSPVVSATPIPSRVTGVTTASARYDAVKLNWGGIVGATGYEVYRSESPKQSYKYVSTVKGNSNTTFTNTGLITGKVYYYKVRAYYSSAGKKIYGNFSNVVNRKPIPGKPAIQSVNNSSSKQLRITWSTISGANGYEVYRCNTSSGTYTRVATVTGGNSLTYTNYGLTSNKIYYYKVRAYRTVNGERIFGLLSAAKSGKVK